MLFILAFISGFCLFKFVELSNRVNELTNRVNDLEDFILIVFLKITRSDKNV